MNKKNIEQYTQHKQNTQNIRSQGSKKYAINTYTKNKNVRKRRKDKRNRERGNGDKK